MKQISLTVLLTLALAAGLVAEEPKELTAAKKAFAENAHPDEAARARYVLSLAALREKLAHSNGNWQAVEAELEKHPAPADADTKAWNGFRVGRWDSSRHQFIFHKDGTWSMWPVEKDVTHGTWKIKGNQYEEMVIVEGGKPDTSKQTIILFTAKDFIYTDGDRVYFDKRGK